MTAQQWRLPVMKPRLPHAASVTPYLKRMDLARTYSNRGPLVRELESRLSEALSVEAASVVVCANATVGLVGVTALLAAQDFTVPAYTFAATPLAVLQAGKRLMFTDVNESTWTLDTSLSSVRNSSSGTVAVLPFGSSRLPNLDQQRGPVVLDAAASLGSMIVRSPRLSSSESLVFSLHATKILGSGEGGFVVFGSPELAEQFRRWINFGFDIERSSVLVGTNAKMSEIQAAYALAVLDQAATELGQWREANQRAQAVSDRLGLWPEALSRDDTSPYWIVEFQDARMKAAAIAALSSRGVETRDWWGDGCHCMPVFRPWAKDSAFPVTDDVASRTLGLPMSRDLRQTDVELVADALEEALAV